MVSIFAMEQGAKFFKASLLDIPEFDGTIMPIEMVPNWVQTGGQNTKHFDDYSSSEFVQFMDYDNGQLLDSSDTSEAARNARITYSVVWSGNYTLDHTEGIGSHPAHDIRIPTGTPVYAVANGIIEKAEISNGGFGNNIVLKVPGAPLVGGGSDTLYVLYAHLDSIDIAVGDIVSKGDPLGKSGNTGTSTTPHLHFQIDKSSALYHGYWPFSSQDAADAGYSFFEAINAGFGLDNLKAHTINPMKWIQEYENMSSTASAGTNDTNNDTSNDSNTSSAELDEFEIEADPDPVQSGETISFEITARDEDGKVMSSFDDSVTFTSSDADIEIPNVDFDDGEAQFEVTAQNSGSVRFSVRSGDVKESVRVTVEEEEEIHEAPDEEVEVDHFSFSVADEVVMVGKSTTVTITALDEDDEVIKAISARGGFAVEARKGTVDPDTITKSDFEDGIATVTYTATDNGDGEVSIDNFSEDVEFTVLSEFKEVTEFELEVEKTYMLGSPLEVKISTLDEDGNITMKSFQGDALVTFSEGEGVANPNTLTSSDFLNGIATVSVTVSEGDEAKIKVKEGVIVGESSRLRLDESKIFSDVDDSDEHADAIKWTKENGVFGGYADGSFKPDNEINRAEITKVLMEGLEFDIDSGNLPFSDVSSVDWFVDYVFTAYDNEVVEGYSDGTFGPANSINRAEFFKILLEADGAPVKTRVLEPDFDDVSEDDWFVGYAQYAYDNELLDFDEEFKGGQNMTRGEVAEAIYQLME